MKKNKKLVDSIRPTISETKNETAVGTLPVEDFPVAMESEKTKEKTEKKKLVNNIKDFNHKLFIQITTVFFVVFLLLSVLAGSVYAHDSLYKNKVFPGVVVWGEKVGGKTFEELITLISEKAKNQKILLKGPDQEYEVKLADLGYAIDVETMALSAYSKGRTSSPVQNYLTRAKLLWSKIDWEPLRKYVRGEELEVALSYTVNEEALNKYVNDISGNIKIDPRDSSVSTTAGNVVVTPAVYGRTVDSDNLKTNLRNLLEKEQIDEIRIKVDQIKPNVIDKAAEDIKVQAESVISRPVNLTYKGEVYRPNRETISSWITFTKTSTATSYTLVVDQAKMKNYFTFLGSKINIQPITRKVRVENGVKETVTREGKNGLLIDEKTLGARIATDLPVKTSIDLEIPTYVANFKTEYEQVIVADWEKYIDINVSTQRMTAYLKGGQVVGSWAVTTGNDSHPTPIGTWLITGKSAITRMTGGTRGIDYYDLPNVHWVSWFKGGGYSIHEAYWRYAFGGQDFHWNGSHGCVNSPISVAKFIFDWAPVGTPVIVHY